MKRKRIRRVLSLERFETTSWTPVIRRRSNTARRAPAWSRLGWRAGGTAADVARLLVVWQGGAR